MTSNKDVVFVVDDDISVRESLEALIRTAGHSVEVFDSPEGFFGRRAKDVPRCLVLDVQLPGLNGLDVQRQLAASDEALQVIFITGYGDIPMSVRAMKAGAMEFLTKPFSDEALLTAIAQGLERSRVVLRQLQGMRGVRDRFGQLTPREREVMWLVNCGLLNKEIAAKLGTAEITVKAHRGRMMQKMQADSVADLVRMAGQLKLGESDAAPVRNE